jgi:hypothetical protein
VLIVATASVALLFCSRFAVMRLNFTQATNDRLLREKEELVREKQAGSSFSFIFFILLLLLLLHSPSSSFPFFFFFFLLLLHSSARPIAF